MKTNEERLQDLLVVAKADGLLPKNAILFREIHPSWVILVLSFLGAQLAVWPFLLFLGMTWGDMLFDPYGASMMSAIALAAGLILLHRQEKIVFLAQLGFTVLLVGIGLLVIAVFELHWERWLFCILGMVLLMLAFVVRVPWVKTLLSAAAAWTLLRVYLPGLTYKWSDIGSSNNEFWQFAQWGNLCVFTLVWWMGCARESRWSGLFWRLGLDALLQGVAAALLLEMLFSTTIFVREISLWGGRTAADMVDTGLADLFRLNFQTISAFVFVLASGLWLAWHWRWWPGRRHAENVQANANTRHDVLFTPDTVAWMLLYGCWAVLALVVPEMGVLAVLFTVSLATGRRRTLVLSLIVLLAQLSAFYYALQWPLAQKAGLLGVLGAVLAVALWGLHLWEKSTAYSQKSEKPGMEHDTDGVDRRWAWFQRTGVAISLLLAMGLSQWDVVKKEQVLINGQKVYIALAPRDPRSLMQGDYMALNFDLPLAVLEDDETAGPANPLDGTLLAVAKLDKNHIATLVRRTRQDEVLKLRDDEILVPIKYMKGDWVVVTNAYFFPEGQGQVFNAARYGEFRVLGQGKVLLAGLVDEKLQRIDPRPDALMPDDQDKQ